MEREVLTYENFGNGIRELAQKIVDSDFVPDALLSIARGGLIVGGALGYALGVKNSFAINVEFYTGEDKRLPVPVVLPPLPKEEDLAGLRILVVDDVADTGETLKTVFEFLKPIVREVRSAVLYEKPRTVIKPDYSWKATELWINFPWSTQEPVRKS